MINWFFILLLIGIPIIVFSTLGFQEKKSIEGPELGKVSIIEVGKEFIKQASHENYTEGSIVGTTFREMVDHENFKVAKLPDLKEIEEIVNYGIRLSSDYNTISYEYSSEKFLEIEYLSKLVDLRVKYEAYMLNIGSYTIDDDTIIHRNSMMQELKEINQQITLLKNSESLEEGWEIVSEYDKYKKFLPSMFAP